MKTCPILNLLYNQMKEIMQQLRTGEYFGHHKEESRLGDITLTDTEYTHINLPSSLLPNQVGN